MPSVQWMLRRDTRDSVGNCLDQFRAIHRKKSYVKTNGLSNQQIITTDDPAGGNEYLNQQ